MCTGVNAPAYGGFGPGYGMGGGMRARNGFGGGYGFQGGMGHGRGRGFGFIPGGGYVETKENLEQRAAFLENELQAVRDRMDEL